MALEWHDTTEINSGISWTCGYCGNQVAGNIGYRKEEYSDPDKIVICPHCKNPTVFIYGTYTTSQYPAATYGNKVESLPENIKELYNEIRRCIQYTAYTSAVLSMRKLLMHIAVEQGAKENLRFVEYISFLEDNGWIPPNGREWVDSIRKKGNESTHEIVLASRKEAEQLLDFVEMLLKFMYEFPKRLQGDN